MVEAVVATGLTEPRWVRAIEIRPADLKGRKIVHHAIARLPAGRVRSTPQRSATPTTQRRQRGGAGGGTFMEWAVGKQGEIMRPNSGKLLLPGSQIHLGHPLLQRRRR